LGLKTKTKVLQGLTTGLRNCQASSPKSHSLRSSLSSTRFHAVTHQTSSLCNGLYTPRQGWWTLRMPRH